MIKWFKSLTSVSKSEQVNELAPSSRIDIGDGKTATLLEMIECERANACHSVHHDDHIEHEGVRYNVGHLIRSFTTHHGHHVMATPIATATHMGYVPGYDEGKAGHNPIAGMHHPRANAEMPAKEEAKVPADKADEKKAESKADIRENAAVETAKMEAVKEEAERSNAAAEKERNNAAFKSLAEAQLKKSFDSASRLNSSGSINDRLARGKNLFGSNTTKN